MKIPVIFFVLFLFFPSISHAQTCLSCASSPGSSMICVGDSAFDVQSRCGSPARQDVTGYTQRRVVDNTRRRGEIKTITEKTEKWYYDCGQGQFNRMLIFRAGVLVEIQELKDHGSGPVSKCW